MIFKRSAFSIQHFLAFSTSWHLAFFSKRPTKHKTLINKYLCQKIAIFRSKICQFLVKKKQFENITNK